MVVNGVTYDESNPSGTQVSYDSLSVASQIITITTDASGDYIISGLLAGLYADFNIELNSCSFTLNQTVDLNNPGAPSLMPFQVPPNVILIHSLQLQERTFLVIKAIIPKVMVQELLLVKEMSSLQHRPSISMIFLEHVPMNRTLPSLLTTHPLLPIQALRKYVRVISYH